MRVHKAFLANKLEHLEKVKARQHCNLFKAHMTDHGEKLGGVWSSLSKESKLQDQIYCLKVPNSNPPQYECDSHRMAELSRNFHDNLQSEDLTQFQNQEEHEQKLCKVLDTILDSQLLLEPNMTEMNWSATEAQIANAIDLGKNKLATGLDGCPYELWKALKLRHVSLSSQLNIRSFNIVRALTEVFWDIQAHDLDPNADFAVAWMCPTFKRKDPTEMGNYHPISLMNIDYKLLTKVMALQLNEHAHTLIHNNQAGFIPRRLIFNHIHLAKAIIKFAEIIPENGSIVLLSVATTQLTTHWLTKPWLVPEMV